MGPLTQERVVGRVSLPEGYDFRAATAYARALVTEDAPRYLSIFALLDDLPDVGTDLLDRVLDGAMTERQVAAISRAERIGASFRQLGYVAYLAGFSETERVIFYEYAEGLGLSQRHAGHLIRRLRREEGN